MATTDIVARAIARFNQADRRGGPANVPGTMYLLARSGASCRLEVYFHDYSGGDPADALPSADRACIGCGDGLAAGAFQPFGCHRGQYMLGSRCVSRRGRTDAVGPARCRWLAGRLGRGSRHRVGSRDRGRTGACWTDPRCRVRRLDGARARRSDDDAHDVASRLLNAAARVGTAVEIAVFGIVAAAGRSVSARDDVIATVTGYQAACLVGIVLVVAPVAQVREWSTG